MAKKILIFSTYPIKNPQHGGQKRLSALVNELRKAGMIVRHTAVFSPDHYTYCDKDDIPLKGKLVDEINKSPFTGDVICGEAIFQDKHVKNKVKKLLEEFIPDIVDIEQAFPYLGVKPLLKEMGLSPIITFGSHNIEYLMKEEMLESLNYKPETIHAITDKIEAIETSLAKDSALTSAVSQSDTDTLKRMGATACVLAPNGIYKTNANHEDVQYWHNTFAREGVKNIVLFVGSAHPPNWIGFQDMVGRTLGFLPKDTRIVFAGSIADYVQHELKKLNLDIGAATFTKRAYFAGRLEEHRLMGLIEAANTILLPITEGGGSNLKTAEAIVSGKKVVATTYAFRGFEHLKALPGITLADKPKDFREGIIKSLNAPEPMRSQYELHLQQSVEWDSCLENLIEGMKAL